MKFTKLRFACLLDNAINLLESSGLDRQTIKEEIGITDGELEALEKGNVEEELAEEERFKIYLEICAENRLTDIEYRVQELWEGESSFLCGFTADEVIGNKRLMNNILMRWERAEGWIDNGSYWNLIDDCIKEETEKERRITE